jgi:hypothetical protein
MTLAEENALKALRGELRRLHKRHPSEDLETALKALAIAPGAFEEVAEPYE